LGEEEPEVTGAGPRRKKRGEEGKERVEKH